MVFGAHDSMITIKMAANAIHGDRYSCNTLARSPAPFGKINKQHVSINP